MNDFNLRKFLVENKLTPQSLLNESEDNEYSVSEPSPEWNARELRVNDEIFISDFKPETISSFRTWAKWLRNQPPYIDVIDNGLTISRIDFKSKSFTIHINGTDKYVTYFFNELDPSKVTLVSESITEQDDYEEFTIDSPSEEWGAQELTVGSIVTPDMWGEEVKKDPNNLLTPWSARALKEPVTITNIEYDSEVFYTRDNSEEFNNTAQWYFDELNPTKAYIVPFEEINESDEDEFDVTPSKEWNIQELTVGSTITPDMWTEKAKNEPYNFDENYNFIAFSEPVKISDISISSLVFDTIDKNGNESRWLFSELDPNKAYIKSSQQDPNLFESDEDEFDVTPSKEWGAKELTIGDIVTPDMWTEEAKNDYPNVNFQKYYIAFSQNVVIKQILDGGYTFTTVPENDEDGEMVQWYSDELDPAKAYIKGSEQDPNLFESDEDEFDNPIEASPEWSAQELTVGSTITPDMWTEKAKKDPMNLERKHNLKAFSQNVVIKSIWDNNTFITVEKGDEGLETMSQWYFDELDPTKAIIVPESITEQDEDEFTVEPSKEWGAQELTVGSTITPDMWSEEAKNSEYNNSHIYNKIALIEPVKIIEIESDRGNDEYFVIKAQDKNGNRSYWSYRELDHTKAYIAPESITEQDEDDFDNPIEASPEWGAQELTVGSTITPDMWVKNEILMKIFPELFINSFKIRKIDNDGFFLNKKVNGKYKTSSWKADFFSFDDLDPTKAYIVPPLNESDEDYFSEPIEASPEWGAQELTIGSRITPDMFTDEAKSTLTSASLTLNPNSTVIISKIYNGFFDVKTFDKNGNKIGSSKGLPNEWLDPDKAYIVPQN